MTHPNPDRALRSEGMSKDGGKTLADWIALPDDAAFELIDGELVEKAAPGIDHGRAQGHTHMALGVPFDRKPGGPHGPGGWWFGTEVDILLDGRVFRPDICGWRRDGLAALAKERPLTVRPDWICEIVSESNRTHDTVKKLRYFQQAGVPHYWTLEEVGRTLTVYRHTPDGYLVALTAEAHERVRAEPFDAIELHVAVLLGDDADE
jgi:Uma2 family endonuclease